MKKLGLVLAFAAVLVFAFSATAMADHSPQFYFKFQKNPGTSAPVQAIFTTQAVKDAVAARIDNGISPHAGYSATTAKCGVCHSVHRAPSGVADINGLVMAAPQTATDEEGLPVASDWAPTASSRYATEAWFGSNAGTQVLLRSTISASCTYCHSSNMFGGYVAGTTEFNALWGSVTPTSWNSFYSHTTGCTSCHSVHGASTMKANGSVGYAILKYKGIKNVHGVNQGLQPNLLTGPLFTDGIADYTTNGVEAFADLTPASGISARKALNTAMCTNCHANYSPKAETIMDGTQTANATNVATNNNIMASLFGATNWTTYNPATGEYNIPDGTEATKVPIGTGVYGQQGNGWLFTYKNHPMVAPQASYATAAQSLPTTPTIKAGTAKGFAVADANSYYCQSCHNSPSRNEDGSLSAAMLDGQNIIQSYPHYTPGYYKLMAPAAADADDYAVVTTLAELREGQDAFFTAAVAAGKTPATMSDTYCLKCHSDVGSMY